MILNVYLKNSKIDVKGEYNTESGRITLYKDSEILNDSPSALSKSYLELRNSLIDEKVIIDNKFVKSKVFDSASAAASVVSNYQCNGLEQFIVDSEQISLNEYLNKYGFDWINTYENIATALLKFKGNREKLVQYLQEDSDQGRVTDVDPFSIFATFNIGKISPESRNKKIRKLAEIINCKNIKDDNLYNGAPRKQLNVRFFWNETQLDDIELLWKFFDVAIKYANNPKKSAIKAKFIELFDEAIKIKGTAAVSLSSALFWIRPRFYISLDKNMEKIIPDYIPAIDGRAYGETYLKIREQMSSKIYNDRGFAQLSWDVLKEKTKKPTITNKDVEIMNENKYSELSKYVSQNTIFYGIPGSGKSYYVSKLLRDANVDKKHFERVLFYPEYSYSDFVGQILPSVDKDNGQISYEFTPGPFTTILKNAINNKNNEEYYLVIEEINRGNAPAIFGDVFQLLDRKEDGQSEYPITNKEVSKVVFGEDGNKLVYIPSNLTILATMNTCDQNVFTLDTAFTRRWAKKRIKNNFDGIDKEKIDKININWKDFANSVNDAILEKCSELVNVEDKLLGGHFVNKKDLENIEMFAEKVIAYLWNDVVKFEKTLLFDSKYKTLDACIDAFVAGVNVFRSDIIAMANLYTKGE